MFGTVLNYVTLRLLGEGANDGQGAIEKGRNWILAHGGATAITSWGKMWLSVENLLLYVDSANGESDVCLCCGVFMFSLFCLSVIGTWSI